MNINVFNTILLSAILVLIATFVFIKNRIKIIRFFKKNQVIRFVMTVFIPFIVPFVLSILFSIDQELFADVKSNGTTNPTIITATIILSAIAIINLVIQFIIWCQEKKENDIRWENFAAKQAFNNLHEIFMGKMIQLRSSYHNGLKQGMLTDADVPYSVFDQIRKITWEFCRTISKITDIPTKDLDAAFIYHYRYKNSTDKDQEWRWITGKGTKFSLTLNNFVGNMDSTFHYMINNNVSTLFYNDKNEAANEQKYQHTYKDHNHKRSGSFVAAKVAFSSNDDTLCEGIIMVNSYGKRFLDNAPGHTEEELMHLILDSIFPCYRQLLSAELAMLYFRHQTDKETKKCQKKKKCKQKPIILPKDLKHHQKAFKCLIATTKKIWTKE